MEDIAICRGCGMALDGSPYYTGKSAFHPRTKEQAKANYYGGWVCCESCDYRACLEQESSFPGAGKATFLSLGAKQRIRNNWG